MESQVSRLERVSAGYEKEVTDGEHESKTVRHNVHGCEKGGLSEGEKIMSFVSGLVVRIRNSPRCITHRQRTMSGRRE